MAGSSGKGWLGVVVLVALTYVVAGVGLPLQTALPAFAIAFLMAAGLGMIQPRPGSS